MSFLYSSVITQKLNKINARVGKRTGPQNVQMQKFTREKNENILKRTNDRPQQKSWGYECPGERLSVYPNIVVVSFAQNCSFLFIV